MYPFEWREERIVYPIAQLIADDFHGTKEDGYTLGLKIILPFSDPITGEANLVFSDIIHVPESRANNKQNLMEGISRLCLSVGMALRAQITEKRELS